MKQNVLLSMLAMTVPMAAFADANVPTAKDGLRGDCPWIRQPLLTKIS